MAKHSSGEWRVDRDDSEFPLNITNGSGVIANVGPCGDPDAEDEANAYLMAASPDLLDACREIDEWRAFIKQHYPDMSGLLRGMERARVAIVKAERREYYENGLPIICCERVECGPTAGNCRKIGHSCKATRNNRDCQHPDPKLRPE